MTNTMDHTICSICSRAKNSKSFCEEENGYNVCYNCKRKNKRFKESYDIDTMTCVCCYKEKPISAFHTSFKRRIKKHAIDKTCRACKINRMVSEYSTLMEYSKIMLDRLKSVIRKYRYKYPSVYIDLDLSLTDIIDVYSEQHGLCNISNKILTHVYCESSQQMAYLYPSNMTLYLKDITKGYRKGNISLVCISENGNQLQKLVDQTIRYQVEQIKLSDRFAQLEKRYGNIGHYFNSEPYFDADAANPIDINNNIPLLSTFTEQPIESQQHMPNDILSYQFEGYDNNYLSQSTTPNEVPQIIYDFTTNNQVSNDSCQTSSGSSDPLKFDETQTLSQEQLDFLNSILDFDTSHNNVSV
ncbi:putative ORFan [Tupanvirus deep ocean]|uniref:ORFan n=2 Tax=Tupanvirus TaxID=2094720 RepID=A0AC62A873_9VIRU|nr:putative ORFan [Tupanvirus deep ocean]QKU33974.1 putative ORFan [Tupanvirus deep ocean]